MEFGMIAGEQRLVTVRRLLLVTLLLLGGYHPVQAAIIYESATLGTTGHTGGYAVHSDQTLGARFSISQTVHVQSIAGHLHGATGTFFGAIVSLSGPNALPTGNPFTNLEVVASAVFTPTSPSSEQTVPLPVTLLAGDYAIVFGSGQFGALGSGSMPTFGQTGSVNIGSPSYLYWNRSNNGWLSGGFDRVRFVVNGQAVQQQVPEPSTLAIWTLFGGLGLSLGIWRRRNKVA